VQVAILSKCGKEVIAVNSTIEGKKKTNSWFYVDFEKVPVPKGSQCVITITSNNSHQFIPCALVRNNIAIEAAKCRLFSQVEISMNELPLGEQACIKNAETQYCFNMMSLSFSHMESEK